MNGSPSLRNRRLAGPLALGRTVLFVGNVLESDDVKRIKRNDLAIVIQDRQRTRRNQNGFGMVNSVLTPIGSADCERLEPAALNTLFDPLNVHSGILRDGLDPVNHGEFLLTIPDRRRRFSFPHSSAHTETIHADKTFHVAP